VSWYDATAYCNWLSEQDGILKEQWCYLPNKEGKYEDGMTMAPDYFRRMGYRLPTEVEWEYACRAGADTMYSFGESADLLVKYAWFNANSLGKSHPVGSLKSNDLGLFDMHGNNLEWCQNAYEAYAKGRAGQATDDTEDIQDTRGINSTTKRALRGGSLGDPASYLRPVLRNPNVPTVRAANLGFRPARTFR